MRARVRRHEKDIYPGLPRIHPAMPRDSTLTREKLIRAAEYLFARHGFDVPIRDIQDRAGQRNATALQYHFGGKRELVWAIIERHTLPADEIQVVRDDLASKQDDPRALVYLSRCRLRRRGP